MPESKHVLVVDDEPQVVFAFRLFFESRGLRVSTASDGDEALHQLAVTSFDAVVTDLHMPNCGGTELIAEMRRHTGEPPVIVITSDDDAERLLTRFDNIQILHKPVHADKILKALSLALRCPPATPQ